MSATKTKANCKLININELDTEVPGKTYKFKTKTLASFYFELALFVLYCLNLIQLFCKKRMMSELKKKRLSVHMIKNYEHSRLFDENDSEDEAKAAPV